MTLGDSYAPEAGLNRTPRRGSSWLRKVHVGGIRLRRKGVSLRTQLILLLGVLVLVATASLGSLAYRTSRTIVERAAIREVGTIATVRKQVLIRALTQQRERADALLKTSDVGCSPDETWCLRKLLVDFVATEGARAARLAYRGNKVALAGENAAALTSIGPLTGSQIAHFEFDAKGQPYYLLQVTSPDGKAVLTIRGDTQAANQIFLDRYGLGQSGETLLTDSHGFFLTPPKYREGSGETRPLSGEPIRMCQAGEDGEALAPDYRGVPAIYGFRHVPEIGGGCILALIDQAEAFAPAQGIARDVAGVSGFLAALAIACSLMFAQLVSRPMKRLTGRARSLQKGDFDSAVPVGGPSEVRMFAQTFEAMAASLKTSRAALQESTEQVRNILESISDGFAAFDRQWRCTYVNDKATGLSRIPGEELLGRNVWEMFPDLARTSVYGALHRAMEERVPVHFEEHHRPFDIWFEVDAYPTRDGLAVFGRDVTERKRFNERLQQAQKLESLGVLAGGIAHDFNNLLTGMIGNASVALEELPAGNPVRGSLEAVVSAGERAAILTRQLLAYAGKGRYVIELLDLSSLVREISNLLRASIPRTVQLRLELREDLPCIEGDAAQVQQLIMNLVINAAEAVGEGKTEVVTITTGLEQIEQTNFGQTIPADSIQPGRYVAVEVRDRGCGMDEETKSRIFDPFFTTKFTGRGLGLAAVMGIVRGHKAALKVDSAPGKGSSFKVLFPASEGQPKPFQHPRREKNLAGRGTILVVDDEDAVRHAAKSALESYGYTVAIAENGKEGVETFQKLGGEIAAVLLDMTMPVMSGEEALVHLKRLRPNVPVLLSSGYDEAETTRRFTGKGLAGFVQKPYTAARLAEKIKTVLEGAPPRAG
ncbi:MAG TPA: response regulator [Bryobacteraceae bacterium]|nr:response regulator [Bryobacteraceae bacterium]